MNRRRLYSPESSCARVLAILISLAEIELTVIGLVLPWWSLTTAWDVIAVYVLIGSVATIGRLIPVPTS